MRREAVRLSPEVKEALASGHPVVALESSVVAQGLPPPHNLESAAACQQAIRAEGAVPAITAVLAGKICAGVSEAELEQLADQASRPLKVGERDLHVAVAQGRFGGTTVSATCVIADAVGIRLFATGGIGGVHRDAERTFDVSQDLAAIARCQVAVVTAGAKAILDLPKTLEVLETLGVPVIGFGVSEFPAFYTSRSGLKLEHKVASALEAARLLQVRFVELGQGGVILANPVPGEAAADEEVVRRAVEEALAEAARQHITGKAVTPFLLGEVARRSGGEALAANLSLLTSNATVAARIAVALSKL